jgi:hypothetical protein
VAAPSCHARTAAASATPAALDPPSPALTGKSLATSALQRVESRARSAARASRSSVSRRPGASSGGSEAPCAASRAASRTVAYRATATLHTVPPISSQ